MNVAIGEAGEHQLSACVDALCADAAVAFDFFVAADGLDLSVTDGDSLRPRLLRVQRVDHGMHNQDVSRGDAGRLLGKHGACDREHCSKQENGGK